MYPKTEAATHGIQIVTSENLLRTGTLPGQEAGITKAFSGSDGSAGHKEVFMAQSTT